MSSTCFGWRIVAISALIYMLLMGSTLGAFGLFVIPVSAEMGLSRAEINSAYVLVSLGNALVAPLIGRSQDRYSSKGTLFFSAILLGGSIASLGLSKSLTISSFLMFIPLPMAILGTSMSVAMLLARWFTIQRGKAMMLATTGMPLGGIVVTPIVAWLVEIGGWRTALITMGGALTVLLLLLVSLLKEAPGPDDREPGVATAQEEAVLVAEGKGPAKMTEILRWPAFWLIAISCAVPMAVGQAAVVSIVPLGLSHGLSIVEASSLLSVMGGSAIGGSLLVSTFADKVRRALLLVGLFVLGAVMCALLVISQAYPALLGCAVLLGISTGTLAPLFYALVADRFGLDSFGTVRGLMAPVVAAMGAIAVRLAGDFYDMTGSYDRFFTAAIGCELVAAVMLYAVSQADRAAGKERFDQAASSRQA